VCVPESVCVSLSLWGPKVCPRRSPGDIQGPVSRWPLEGRVSPRMPADARVPERVCVPGDAPGTPRGRPGDGDGTRGHRKFSGNIFPEIVGVCVSSTESGRRRPVLLGNSGKGRCVMKRIVMGAGMVAGGLMILVVMSSRPLGDLFGYARATADTTVGELETSLPDAVRDQKVQNQLEDARGELIDRRVSLSLATGQIRDLQQEVSRLKTAIERRQTILADAWPAMETAAGDRSQPVQFAGSSWQPDELGAEVDRLLSEQDRDEVQLKVRSEALARLEHSVQESQSAVSDMDTRLQQVQTDFELLKMRREQAQSESDLLDLLATAGSSGDSTTGRLAGDLTALEQQVREREARNNARRESAPLSESGPSRLIQSYERLERLKTLHEQRKPATEGK